ncbi:MAG TPA: DegT/DnrJ/EryC1/StrS aminotransferase family protein [Baekduia sp.]|uniref:DegT/DnrJ/EryC1/StrS family aminotransferase n=1 Tax=Baekduia sp. TaxID=2600305 RepID=UPI002D78845B|nr:DegT/DnrJ/EryC1/StrS aminotransferase family protein [Baekduia sp.]HET6506005.1 DegT/DnrJ/EryC1/StrS aminotransferase family protein [Baekduia sp.]
MSDTELDVIPIAQPVIGREEEAAVLEVLRSGHLSLGPRVPEFERRFADFVGARCASAVSSGTTALHLAYRAVGVTDGTEVVTSPFTFVATANAAVYERARPVFADIDPVTLNLDPEAARAAITERTSAIVPVHIFGYPADMKAFEAMGVPLVEDAAQGLGGVHHDGVPIGGRGHPAIFGFYPNKQLATGEGGMIALGSEAMKVVIDSERNQGRAPNMDWLDHDRLGFNYRLSDVACAIGLAQMDRLARMLADRARAAAWYREALAPLATERGLGLPCADGATIAGDRRGWFVFVVQVPHDGPSRDDVIRALRDRGVQSKPYLPAVHLMSYYRETFGYREGQFPICEDIASRSLALPFFPAITQSQVARVSATLADILS